MAGLPSKECCAINQLHVGTPTGQIQEISGLTCYTTSNYSKSSKKFLFIFSDIFGLRLLNTKLIADIFGTELKYPVIIMDILNNDPYIEGMTDREVFRKNHPVELTVEVCRNFFKSFAKDHQIDFCAVIGYCFGAKYLSHYLTTDGIIDVGAFAHPSHVSDDELAAIAKPLIISCAEKDRLFTDDAIIHSKKILSESRIHYHIDTYSGTTHGFAVRGDLSNPIVRYAVEKTIADQVQWFKYHENDSLINV